MIRRLLSFVQERARRHFVVLLIMVVLNGLVELAGISATAEMMGLVASQGKSTLNGPLGRMLGFFHVESPILRLEYGLVWAVGVLAMVHGYNTLKAYLQAQFAWLQEKEISTRLFATCLHRPYAWFLERNTAEVNRMLGANGAVQGLLGSFLAAVGQGATAITLTVALFVADYRVALSAVVIVSLAYGVVRKFTKKSLVEKGGGAHRADAARRMIAQESLTNIRFVKTTGREDFFVEEYGKETEKASKSMVFHSIYVGTVRSFLEWVTFACLLTLSVYLVTHSDGNMENVLPRLTLYTMAGYRLVPAVHELFNLWSMLKFNEDYFLLLDEYLEGAEHVHNLTREPVQGLSESKDLVRLEHVTFRYKGATRKALDGVDLVIPRGYWLGVVGTTGAGKTTLLDIIAGLCIPETGQVVVGESVLTREVATDWQSRLGVVPQEVILLDDSLARNVAFGTPVAEIDRDLVLRVLELAGLERLLSTLPEGLDTRMGERGTRLSGGERQRVGIARALYRKPAILLLDEATSALDQATEATIIETLRDLTKECTLITVAHRLSSVQPCDSIVVVEDGRIVSRGTFEELLETSAQFRKLALYSTPAFQRDAAV